MRKAGRLRHLASATLVVLALGLAACGSGGPNAGTDPTTTPTVTEEQPATTVTETRSTSPAPPAAGTIPFITEPPTDTATTAAEGSGCAPPSATSLPDGKWFGLAAAVDPPSGTIDLDLACLFFFDAANVAATEDGASEVPVPNDYWFRNKSPNLYTLRAVPDVAVGLVPDSFSDGKNLVPVGNGLAAAVPALGRSVWIQVVDGWVVAIQQQYFP